MPIKQTRYVDIASAVIGASAVPERKLTARLFSADPKIPAGHVLEFAPGQVDELLGGGFTGSSVCPSVFQLCQSGTGQ
ncbi:hypothetical protein P4W15_04390 [Morganella morganii]|nr:hypothetical protein [Morganella morganii]